MLVESAQQLELELPQFVYELKNYDCSCSHFKCDASLGNKNKSNKSNNGEYSVRVFTVIILDYLM